LKLFDARVPGGRVSGGFGVFANRSGAAFGLEKSIAQAGRMDAITQRAEAEAEDEDKKNNWYSWHYPMRPEVLKGCLKTAPRTVIRRCAAIANAHISSNMLRFPKRRTPWLTARCLFLKTLLNLQLL
jgi:hypothetical protein